MSRIGDRKVYRAIPAFPVKYGLAMVAPAFVRSGRGVQHVPVPFRLARPLFWPGE